MKTKEQAAFEYAKGYLNHEKSKIYESFLAGIDFAEQQISVDDELPEEIKDPDYDISNSELLLLKTEKGIFLGSTLCGKFPQTHDKATHWRLINRK